MAVFMDLVSLTGLQNPTDILGIQEAHDDNNILVIYTSVYIFSSLPGTWHEIIYTLQLIPLNYLYPLLSPDEPLIK